MKTKLLLLSLLSTPVIASDYNWIITDIKDGDTLGIEIHELPKELQKMSIRLLNVDTPETHLSKCTNELELGKKATLFTTNVINNAKLYNQSIEYTNIKWDKYGSRFNANVIINGKNLSEMLIEQGLAFPYNGKKKINHWCN